MNVFLFLRRRLPALVMAASVLFPAMSEADGIKALFRYDKAGHLTGVFNGSSDPSNCGALGNACPGQALACCLNGACGTFSGGQCVVGAPPPPPPPNTLALDAIVAEFNPADDPTFERSIYGLPIAGSTFYFWESSDASDDFTEGTVTADGVSLPWLTSDEIGAQRVAAAVSDWSGPGMLVVWLPSKPEVVTMQVAGKSATVQGFPGVTGISMSGDTISIAGENLDLVDLPAQDFEYVQATPVSGDVPATVSQHSASTLVFGVPHSTVDTYYSINLSTFTLPAWTGISGGYFTQNVWVSNPNVFGP
jgi:hypothetical protein